jgi:putative SOS response-associated peptidase YedK
MCSNYRPVTQLDRLLTFFGVERASDDPTPEEVYPTGLAPFIRLHKEGSGNKVVQNAVFGLLPPFAKELAYGRKTYNARSETVDKLPSYRAAWRKGQRCIIPAESIFEPCYETGKAVRHRIQHPGNVPMGVAGIYEEWTAPDGKTLFSMSMLTVNAEGHPVFGRMHRPEDEKRMIVILHPNDYDDWLACNPLQAKAFFKQWTEPLEDFTDIPPPRAPRAISGKVIRPPTPPEPDVPTTGELF